MTGTNISINKYVLQFTAIYAGLLIALNIVVYFTSFQPNSGINIALFIGAVAFASGKFAQDNLRQPSNKESLLFALVSNLAGWPVSVIIGIIFVIIENGGEESLDIMAAVTQLFGELGSIAIILFAVFFLLYFLGAYAGFRFIAKSILKSMEKKRNEKPDSDG